MLAEPYYGSADHRVRRELDNNTGPYPGKSLTDRAYTADQKVMGSNKFPFAMPKSGSKTIIFQEGPTTFEHLANIFLNTRCRF